MGILDSLKKIGEDLGKEIEKNVGSEAMKDIKNAVSSVKQSVSNEINAVSSPKEIPAEYSEFPTFRDEVKDLTTKETDKYIRCTMNFNNVTEEELSNYISKINSLGYVKGSNVRYDKGNTYIIVDDNYGDLNLVFHIKR